MNDLKQDIEDGDQWVRVSRRAPDLVGADLRAYERARVTEPFVQPIDRTGDQVATVVPTNHEASPERDPLPLCPRADLEHALRRRGRQSMPADEAPGIPGEDRRASD